MLEQVHLNGTVVLGKQLLKQWAEILQHQLAKISLIILTNLWKIKKEYCVHLINKYTRNQYNLFEYKNQKFENFNFL
jgi:hypothetical protein